MCTSRRQLLRLTLCVCVWFSAFSTVSLETETLGVWWSCYSRAAHLTKFCVSGHLTGPGMFRKVWESVTLKRWETTFGSWWSLFLCCLLDSLTYSQVSLRSFTPAVPWPCTLTHRLSSSLEQQGGIGAADWPVKEPNDNNSGSRPTRTQLRPLSRRSLLSLQDLC